MVSSSMERGLLVPRPYVRQCGQAQLQHLRCELQITGNTTTGGGRGSFPDSPTIRSRRPQFDSDIP